MPEQKEREVSRDTDIEPVERREELQVPEEERGLEVESVVEKIERNKTQTQGDVQDDVGNVVVQQSDQPAVTVPVTQDDMVVGAKAPISDSFRWLIEWVKRQIKKFHGRVVYRKPESDNAES